MQVVTVQKKRPVPSGAKDLGLTDEPDGSKNGLNTLPHIGCKVNGDDIIATFHTHPNTGADYAQEPSSVDVDVIREDVDLKGDNYVGEFVIAIKHIYQISPTGDVSIAAFTNHVLWILP